MALAQCFELCLALFKEAQTRTDDFARVTVAAFLHLRLHEIREVLAEGNTDVHRHIHGLDRSRQL